MKAFLYPWLLFLVLSTTVATAQAPDWHWTANMGWPGRRGLDSYFTPRQLIPTTDGGALVVVNLAGSLNMVPPNDTIKTPYTINNGVLIKYSATGSRE